MVPVVFNTPSYLLGLKWVCIALKVIKIAVVLVLFPSLLLRNWFYWWLVHCLTSSILSEVLSDQKFYIKLKKSHRLSLGMEKVHQMTSCVAEWGSIALEILSLKVHCSCIVTLYSSWSTCSPQSQADFFECATSEIIIYTEDFVSSSLHFFIGPALDNACWADHLRGSQQRKGQYLVSSIIYDRNAGKNGQKGWF